MGASPLRSPVRCPRSGRGLFLRSVPLESARQFAKELTRRFSDSVGRLITRYLRPPGDVRQLPEPEAVSMELLKRWLSREQLKHLETKGWFEVIGGDTGKRYRREPE